MNIRKLSRVLVLVCVSVIACATVLSQDTKQLGSLSAKLKSAPDDDALREQIIKLALSMDPVPATPEDAIRHASRAIAAGELAKQTKDYGDTITEYQEASLAAPWLPEPYFALALIEEARGDYGAELKDLKFYVMCETDAAKAQKGKERLYQVEYKKEKADQANTAKKQAADAEEREQQERAADAAKAEEERRQRNARLDGRVWVYHDRTTGCDPEIRFVQGHLEGWGCCPPRATCSACRGRELCKSYETQEANLESGPFTHDLAGGIRYTFSLSPDRGTMTFKREDPYTGTYTVQYQSKQ
jgi:hypothetical protein